VTGEMQLRISVDPGPGTSWTVWTGSSPSSIGFDHGCRCHRIGERN